MKLMATKIIEVAQDNTFVAKLKYKSSFVWYVFKSNIWKKTDYTHSVGL